jgi:hypothetical protein
MQFNKWISINIERNKPKKNRTPIHDVSQQMDECIPYEELSTTMKKLNDEQIFIVNDIIYIYPSKPLHNFFWQKV